MRTPPQSFRIYLFLHRQNSNTGAPAEAAGNDPMIHPRYVRRGVFHAAARYVAPRLLALTPVFGASHKPEVGLKNPRG
jgi:hypothetical protein